MTFAEWWGTINWSDAPAWLAAVGTVGSLLLGFSIVARDRYVSRRASANGLISTVDTIRQQGADDRTAGFKVTVNVYNAGTAPIYMPALFSTGKQSLMMMSGSKLERALFPGEHSKWTRAFIEDPGDVPLLITFVDASNKRWRRDIRLNKYVSHAKMLRLTGQ